MSRILFLTLVTAVLAAVAVGHAAVEVIVVHYRNASEVLPLVKPLLTPEGKLSADDRTGQLIIVDSEEAIARVRQLLATLDRPAPQAMVRVRFEESAAAEERSISGGGRVSGDEWSVSAGRGRRDRDGVDVHVQDQSESRSGSSEYFIRTLSGTWAYILVGRDIPYTTRWRDLCRRYGQTVVFQRLETGFEVRPMIQGETAVVDIVPRLAEMGSPGGSGVVRFAEAAAQIRVPLGQWVTIGGSDQAGSEAVRAILEAGTSQRSSALSIQMMVESR